MRKLLILSAIILASCTKEENCAEASRIFVDGDVIKQEFNDNTIVVLGPRGEVYTPFNNTCEL